MLVHHLLSGLIIGMLATVAGLLQGYSMLSVIGFYIIGTNVGLAASILGARSSFRDTEVTGLTSVLR